MTSSAEEEIFLKAWAYTAYKFLPAVVKDNCKACQGWPTSHTCAVGEINRYDLQFLFKGLEAKVTRRDVLECYEGLMEGQTEGDLLGLFKDSDPFEHLLNSYTNYAAREKIFDFLVEAQQGELVIKMEDLDVDDYLTFSRCCFCCAGWKACGFCAVSLAPAMFVRFK